MAKPIRLTPGKDNYTGTNGADVVFGLDGNDKINGGKGADTLNGGNGNDRLDGGGGNDTLRGGAGDDRLIATLGNDIVNGGDGKDTVFVSGNFADAEITEINGGYSIELNGRTTIVKNIEFVKFDDVKVNERDLINDAPTGTATEVLAAGTEDNSYTVTAADLLNGFSDVNKGDTLSVADLASSNGTVTDNGDGTYTITPTADFNGTVNLTYNVTDGELSVAATQHFEVAAANDAPTGTATAVLADGVEDNAYTVTASSLLQGFSDVDGDTLSVANLASSNGTVTDNGDGTYTITPAADFNGAVTLSYNVTDGVNSTATATRSFNLAAANDAPTGDAIAVLAAGTEDAPYTVNASDLLQGFSDVDGDTLSVANLASSNGTVTDNGDGTYTITPTADFNGTVNLTYDVTDGTESVAATQSYTVTAVNDDPTVVTPIADQAASEDAAFTYTVDPAAFADVDTGDTLTYTATLGDGTALPAWLAFDPATGVFSGTPAEGDIGAIDVKVTASDGTATASDTFQITVGEVNDIPVVTGVADVQVEDSTDSLFPTFAIADEEGDFGAGTKLVVTSNDGSDRFSFNTVGGVSIAANIVLVNGVGVGTFTPATGDSGALTITFNADATEALIEAVGQAITISVYDPQTGNFGSGTSNVSVTLTDSEGAVSDVVTAEVLSVDEFTPVSIAGITGDSQVTGISEGALAVDDDADADVTYVQTVGRGNVDSVKLTIELGGEDDAADLLALPTALSGTPSVANIAGNLVYRLGGTEYNVGTVEAVGSTITVSLNNDVYPASNLSANDFDNLLSLVISSTTVNADGSDGVRDVTFTIDGVGDVSTTATAQLVVTDGGTIELTADSNTATPMVVDGDTNTSLGTIDATGINVFNSDVGTLTSEDNFTAGSTVNDILTAVLDNVAKTPTIVGVDTFNLSGNIGGGVLNAANISNSSAMEINITGTAAMTVTNIGSTFTTVDASDSTGAVTLTTQDGHGLEVITGSGATSIDADDSVTVQATVTVDVENATATTTLIGSADFVVEGSAAVAINASATTDSLIVESVAATLTLTAGLGAVTVEDIASTATLTINGDAVADDALITVSGSGTVNIDGTTGFKGDINAAGLSGSLIVELSDDETTAETASIILGSGAFASVSAAGADDTVTINAAAAAARDFDLLNDGPDLDMVVDNDIENASLMITGNGTYVVNNLTANVDADAVTGSLNLNVLAGADIDVVAADLTTIMGAATLVDIDASGLDAAADEITIGSLANGFAGAINVTGLGAAAGSTLDATYLTGALTVATDDVSSTIFLGAGNSSLTLDAVSTTTMIDATGFTGGVVLSGSGNVVATAVGNITIDGDDSTVTDDDFAGDLDVTLKANATTTIVAGIGSITVTGSDVDTVIDAVATPDGIRSAITIDATETGSGEVITINDSLGGFNVNTTVTGLGDGTTVNLAGSNEVASNATVSLTTATLDADTVTVALGTSQTVSISSSVVAAGTGTVNVNAAAAIAGDFDDNGLTAATNAQITLTGSSNYVLTTVSADVSAAAATGVITIGAAAATNALSLTTGSGNDIINAGSGADTIVAGAGADRISGGAGVDTMTGGLGIDTFVFVNGDSGVGAANRDHITDFTINGDIIDLSSGTYAAVADFGDLLISIGATSTVITIDENGDGIAAAGEDQITLDGNFVGQSFSGSDFIF